MSEKPRKAPSELRSHRWYGRQDLRTFTHRSRVKQQGYAESDFDQAQRFWERAVTCSSRARRPVPRSWGG